MQSAYSTYFDNMFLSLHMARPAFKAQAKYAALVATDETRDTQDATIDSARLDLADDRTAIARAQHRLKAQLELTSEEPEKVYSFFDFSASKESKKSKKKAAKVEPTM